MSDEYYEILKGLRRIETLLNLMRKPKPSWVPAATIIELTGWSSSQMATARKNDTLTYKITKTGGYLYDLNSVHPLLVKKAE